MNNSGYTFEKKSKGLSVLNLALEQNQKIYTNLLQSIGYSNPYASIIFMNLFSGGLKQLVCFKWTINKQFILLVGYLKPVNNNADLVDFTSPYGYSGPIFSKELGKEYLKLFWISFDSWCANNKVITSFIRFSLNKNSINYTGELKPTLLNVKGKIVESNEQWRKFAHKVRKNVNKAIREGLEAKIIKGTGMNNHLLEVFYKVYTTSLSRNSASKQYYYSRNYFNKYCTQLGDTCVFAFVYDANKAVAVEMILLSAKEMYSFLGGTLQASFSKRPNDLLKFTLINWARNNEYTYFILGGGVEKCDGIFNYKKSFFPADVLPFYTGRKVFNESKYLELSAQKNALLSSEEKQQLITTDFFPKYRFVND